MVDYVRYSYLDSRIVCDKLKFDHPQSAKVQNMYNMKIDSYCYKSDANNLLGYTIHALLWYKTCCCVACNTCSWLLLSCGYTTIDHCTLYNTITIVKWSEWWSLIGYLDSPSQYIVVYIRLAPLKWTRDFDSNYRFKL